MTDRQEAADFKELVKRDLRGAAANWKDSDVRRFNATSWAHVAMAMVGLGGPGFEGLENTPEERREAMGFARTALAAAARYRQPLLRRLVGSRPDPVAYYRSIRLAPEPNMLVGALNAYGIGARAVLSESDRLLRHEVLAALVLDALEREPSMSVEAAHKVVGDLQKRFGIP